MRKLASTVAIIGLLGTTGCFECKVREEGVSAWTKLSLNDPQDWDDARGQCRQLAKDKSFWGGFDRVEFNAVQKDAEDGSIINQETDFVKPGSTACRVYYSKTDFENGVQPLPPPSNGIFRWNDKSFTIVQAHNFCRGHAQDRANDHGQQYFWTGRIELVDNDVTLQSAHHGEGIVNPNVPPPSSPVVGNINCSGTNLTGPMPTSFINFYGNVTESNKCAFAQQCVTQYGAGTSLAAYLDLSSTPFNDNILVGQKSSSDWQWDAEGENDCAFMFPRYS